VANVSGALIEMDAAFSFAPTKGVAAGPLGDAEDYRLPAIGGIDPGESSVPLPARWEGDVKSVGVTV
jgi:hypothetical protein